MSAITAVAPARGLSPARPSKRWTTAEFDELVSKGIIREGSRTFLWDGEIIEPMAENRAHINAVRRSNQSFELRFPEAEYTVDQGAPLELRDGFKPQPDLTVLKGPRGRYKTQAPIPTDVVLLVEVADTSYALDAGPYLREYAAAGITQYWIVNIPERRAEVYTNPGRAADGTWGYRDRADYGLGETVPVVGEYGGVPFDLGGVPVRDVLRDSLEPEAR